MTPTDSTPTLLAQLDTVHRKADTNQEGYLVEELRWGALMFTLLIGNTAFVGYDLVTHRWIAALVSGFVVCFCIYTLLLVSKDVRESHRRWTGLCESYGRIKEHARQHEYLEGLLNEVRGERDEPISVGAQDTAATPSFLS